MGKDVLYENESIDFSVSDRFLSYTGQIISTEDIHKVKCKQNKANFAIGQAFFVLGFLLMILGKFREGFVMNDLFYWNTYLMIANGWEILGKFLLFISLMIFLILRDKDTIQIQLKNGKAVQFDLFKKKNLFINDVERAIKQAVQQARMNSNANYVKLDKKCTNIRARCLSTDTNLVNS